MINLDGAHELDEPEDAGDEFPEIPNWEFRDPYGDVKVTVEVSADGSACLTVVAGDPDHGAYQRITVEIPDEAITRLGRDHITPLATWVEAEEARQHEDSLQRSARDRAAADARPWAVQTARNGAEAQQVRVHRSECPVITSSGATPRGEVTFGGTHNGQELITQLNVVEQGLGYLISKQAVESKLYAQRRADQGYVRGTKFDRRPLVMCLRCKPLGDLTGELMAEVERLTNTTVVESEQVMDVITLMDRLRACVWEEEQKHLDRYVRGGPEEPIKEGPIQS